MAQEIKTIDGGEAPDHARSGAHGTPAKVSESSDVKKQSGDTMKLSGGEAPSPGYVPDPVDTSKKAMEPTSGKDPELGGVATKR